MIMARAREIHQDNLQKGDLSTRVNPKGTKSRQSTECCFGRCFKQTHQDLSKTSLDDKTNKKSANSLNIAISMARRWCECEWHEAVITPCLSGRVIQTALRFSLESSDVSNDIRRVDRTNVHTSSRSVMYQFRFFCKRLCQTVILK